MSLGQVWAKFRGVKRRKRIEKVEANSVRIYEQPVHSKGRKYKSYRIVYFKEGRRVRERARTLELARNRVQELKGELKTGTVHVGTLTAKQKHVIGDALEMLEKEGGQMGLLEALNQFFEAKRLLAGKATTVPDAVRGYLKVQGRAKLEEITFPELVEKYIVWVKAQKSRRYSLDMRARLRTAAKTLKKNIADIKTADIDEWLQGMKKVSGRTKNNYRTAVRTLFRYARDKNYLPRQEKTEAEFTSRYAEDPTDIEIYTVDQIKTLLTHITPRMVPFVALGAFAGLRSAEITRLEWKHVRFDTNVIVVPVTVAKTSNRRLAPILPVLRAWLKPFEKDKGKVLVDILDEFALARALNTAFQEMRDKEGKPLIKNLHNGLRHSFVSYRVSATQNVHQVSLESGNTPRIIFSNYRELVEDPKQAEAYFKIMPTKVRLKQIKDFTSKDASRPRSGRRRIGGPVPA